MQLELRDFVSFAALLLSGLSLWIAKSQWRQANRPMVTAFVTDRDSGVLAATFDLVIANTGNRPAVNVRLLATREEISKLLKPDATESSLAMILSNFEEAATIPLLRNGEELRTSFGAMTAPSQHDPWLEYGASIDIKVSYEDVDRRRRYDSLIPLKVYTRHGFGGGVWS